MSACQEVWCDRCAVSVVGEVDRIRGELEEQGWLLGETDFLGDAVRADV